MADDTGQVSVAEQETFPLETDAERAARAAIPAIDVDTWFVTTWRGHLRLTFGETVSGLDTYRSAIVLELQDAERLCDQMRRMIERRKAKEGQVAET